MVLASIEPENDFNGSVPAPVELNSLNVSPVSHSSHQS